MGICKEKTRLQDDLLHAVSQLSHLHAAKIINVADGAGRTLTEDIEVARQRKNDAKDALVAHLHEHGCWAEGLVLYQPLLERAKIPS